MQGTPEVGDIRPNHRFDIPAVERYLAKHVPEFRPGGTWQQFQRGQSNPTFLYQGEEEPLVVRKKPPGKLLPSAHQIEREHRVYAALASTPVPVPRVFHFCHDGEIMGTPFLVMEFVTGRTFSDPQLTTASPEDRLTLSLEMVRVLAEIHRVDLAATGLADFGKAGNYFARQTSRWSQQYRQSETDALPEMEQLMAWLPNHLPADESTTLVHGDYQLYNLLFDQHRPRCSAVLDWELSTLGHPLADLAYHCMKYHTVYPGWHVTPGDGIPEEQTLLNAYCESTGRVRIEDWNFCLAFSLFRLASIVQGVYRRGLDGNAASPEALQMRDLVGATATQAWQIAQRRS